MTLDNVFALIELNGEYIAYKGDRYVLTNTGRRYVMTNEWVSLNEGRAWAEDRSAAMN